MRRNAIVTMDEVVEHLYNRPCHGRVVIDDGIKERSTNITGSMAVSKKRCCLLAIGLFILYFTVLFYFLFFSEELGRTYSERTYHYNLVPFKEIGRFIRYHKRLGTGTVLLNIVGNVAAFVPFGIFLPVFSTRCRKFWFTAYYSFELSLLVELLQLVAKVGSFDVDRSAAKYVRRDHWAFLFIG